MKTNNFTSSNDQKTDFFNKIPKILASADSWVVWRLEWRNGKLTKPPYSAKTGKFAKTNDPSTWADLPTAIAAYNNGGKYSGIGIAMTGDLCGIDLDHVIDKETGEIAEFAQTIVNNFRGTYCEISPSGDGLRIFCTGKAKRSGKGTNLKTIEVYDKDSPRYLTFTGKHLTGTSNEVTEQQAALDWLYETHLKKTEEKASNKPNKPATNAHLDDDMALIEKATYAKNGGKFSALYGGDTSGHASHSEADAALCSMLAFWTQDPAQIDRIFRTSGLFREKWDKKHHADGRTYGQSTIGNAIQNCTTHYDPQPRPIEYKNSPPLGESGENGDFPIQKYPTINPNNEPTETTRQPLRIYSGKDLADILTHQFPPRVSVLEPILTLSSLNMIFAWRGVGKTYFSLYLAYAAATGGDFLKWKSARPFKTLYIDGEMPGEKFQARLAAIVAASNKQPEPGYFKAITIDLENGIMPDLSTREGHASIADACDKAELIIVDNLSTLVRGTAKENEAASWNDVAEWALSMRSKGKCVLFIHHAGKDGNQRGTSKREDILDVSISLKRPSDYHDDQGARFELRFEKARHLYGADAEPFEAWLTMGENGQQAWSIKPLTETTYERVVELANLGMNQIDIAKELEIHKSTVCRAWRKGEENGDIKKRKEPKETKKAPPRSYNDD